ncbi:MAG: transposase [Patescibacteria group bacterium]
MEQNGIISPPQRPGEFYLAAKHHMRNLTLSTGEYYHVYNRGVDRRKTFRNHENYRLFLYFAGRSKHDNDTGKHVVNIHAYACMTNHFHMLLEQTRENGIAQFMQRLSTSYTRAFNRQHQRSGSLFETTYKARHVDTDAYLDVVATYIHRNPLAIPETIDVETLDSYQWSSYPHYRGLVKNPLVDDKTLSDLFGAPNHTQKFHQRISAKLDDYRFGLEYPQTKLARN